VWRWGEAYMCECGDVCFIMCNAYVIDFSFSSILCCHHTFSFSHSFLITCSPLIHPLPPPSHFTSTLFSPNSSTPFLTPNSLLAAHLSLLSPSFLLVQVGEDRLIRFSGCKSGSACTIILRGASSHLLDEAERSLHDALCVLTETVKETRWVCVCVEKIIHVFRHTSCFIYFSPLRHHFSLLFLPSFKSATSPHHSSPLTSPLLLNRDHRVLCGGGCLEMLMATAIDRQVPQVAGKAALAMEAFSRALRQLPTIIADNAGLDSSELVTQLRAAHASGLKNSGLDVVNGCVGDMWALGVRESYKSKLQVLVSAAEAAEMILRVDDIIKCAPRERQERH
jgi:chaperonin GroEL (HSP60 family)